MTDSTATASSTQHETLTVRDNRTGVEYDVPILDGTVKAADLGQIRVDEESPGLAVYDPFQHAGPDALYAAADEALYRAKANGRNRLEKA